MKETAITSITTLNDLLDYDARRFTKAEIQLKNSIQEWLNKSASLKLKDILHKYLDFVKEHITKLDSFLETEEISSLSTNSRIMQAFIDELQEKMNYCTDDEVRDACLLAGIQEINHFKISIYGTAAAFAKINGKEQAAALFHEIEVNEKQIDDRLSQLAEFEINMRARAPISLTL